MNQSFEYEFCIDIDKKLKMQQWLEEVGCEKHLDFFKNCTKSKKEYFYEYLPFFYKILRYFNNNNERGFKLVPLYKHGMSQAPYHQQSFAYTFYKMFKDKSKKLKKPEKK